LLAGGGQYFSAAQKQQSSKRLNINQQKPKTKYKN
jgi:hypothetical protein